MYYTHLKALLSKLCLLEILVPPYTSLIIKFEVCNFLTSKLEHFENDIHFCWDIQLIWRHFNYFQEGRLSGIVSEVWDRWSGGDTPFSKIGYVFQRGRTLTVLARVLDRKLELTQIRIMLIEFVAVSSYHPAPDHFHTKIGRKRSGSGNKGKNFLL